MINKTEPSVWGNLFPLDIRNHPSFEIGVANDVWNDMLWMYADKHGDEWFPGGWPRLELKWIYGPVRGH